MWIMGFLLILDCGEKNRFSSLVIKIMNAVRQRMLMFVEAMEAMGT